MSDDKLKVASLVLGFCFSTFPAAGAIEVVGQYDVTPIEQLDAAVNTPPPNRAPNTYKNEYAYVGHDYDSNNGTYYKPSEIRKALFEKYETLDNMLLVVNKMPLSHQNVVRELVMENMLEQQQRLAELKRENNLALAIQSRANITAERKALNDPSKIIEDRKFNTEVNAAQNRPVYESEVNVRSIPYDPNGTKQIAINNRVNSPTVISFFDVTGQPYPIKSHIPDSSTYKTESFEVMKTNDNQLLVIPKVDNKDVSGFVFLKDAAQPVSFRVTSYPEKTIDSKVSVMLPTISPENSLEPEALKVSFQKLNRDDDPNLSSVLSGRPPANAQPLVVSGLPPRSLAYKIDDYYYFRTEAILKYEIDAASRIGNLHVFRAAPRATYFFYVDNVEKEVSVHE